MSATAATVKTQAFRALSAVDLVTLAVFAALYRALWYVWHALGFLFPFNQLLSDFFYVLCGVAAIVIVRKFGAFTLFAVAAQAVNVFLQGEMLVVALIMVLPGVLADVYIYLQAKSGKDVFSSFSAMFMAGTIAGATWSLVNWALIFPVIFLTELSVPLYIAAAIACLLGGMAGAWAGYKLGDKVKGLIS
jgi:hypothetical protein